MKTLLLTLLCVSLASTHVAVAQDRSEDVDTAPAAAPRNELPWFIPSPQVAFAGTDDDLMSGWSLQLAVEPMFFVGSNQAVGPGAAVLLRYENSAFGFDIGYMNAPMPYVFNAAAAAGATQAQTLEYNSPSFDNFLLGVSFIHSGAELVHAGRHHLYVMFPEIDVRVLLNPSSATTTAQIGGVTDTFRPATFALEVGGSLTAIRYAICLGHISLLAEVRGPIAFAMIPFPGDFNSVSAAAQKPGNSVSPYASLGFGVSLGIGF